MAAPSGRMVMLGAVHDAPGAERLILWVVPVSVNLLHTGAGALTGRPLLACHEKRPAGESRADWATARGRSRSSFLPCCLPIPRLAGRPHYFRGQLERP